MVDPEICRQLAMYQDMALKGDELRRKQVDEIALLRALLQLADYERAVALRKLAEVIAERNDLKARHEPPPTAIESPEMHAISVMQKNGVR